MNARHVSGRYLRYSLPLAAALLCLGAASCFRNYDISKVQCHTDKDCPKAYPSCVLADSGPGICSRNVDGGSNGGAGGRQSRSDSFARGDASAPGGSSGLDAPIAGAGGTIAGGQSSQGGNVGGTVATATKTGTGGVATGGSSGGVATGGSSGGVATGGSSGGVATGGSSGGTQSLGGSTASSDTDAPRPQGTACTLNSQCESGLCIDEFCCDKDCDGCNACAGALTKKADGTCAPVAAGADPHESCVDETKASPAKPCGQDGLCDGKGGCRMVGEGQECGTASCSADGKFTPAPECDGSGTCGAGTAQSCAPYECAITGCKRACSAQEPCDASSYCDAGVCVSKKPFGDTCTAATASQCKSGFCVDGHCCAQASCGTCQSCTGTSGTCVAVTSVEDDDSCNGTKSCDARGACKKKQGQTCGTSSECVTTFCADGYCCDKSCAGACESCSDAIPGTCGFVSGAAKHGTCSGSGLCQGRCDGTSTNCAPASTTTVCREPTCDSSTNTQTAQATCTTSGACRDVTPTSCGAFKCGSTACLTTCTSSSLHCVAGAACLGSACQMCESGQSVCGNACVSTKSDPKNCGGCGAPCNEDVPYCVNSTCVECQTATNCPSGYMSCNAGTCGCRQPHSGNKLVNPGFDRTAAPWALNGGVFVSTSDADNCPGSGLIEIPTSASIYTIPFQQCISVGGGVPYRFGFRYQGIPRCNIEFFSASGCNNTDQIEDSSKQNATDTNIPLWSDIEPIIDTTPAATKSVLISCVIYPFGAVDTRYDQMYFNTDGASF